MDLFTSRMIVAVAGGNQDGLGPTPRWSATRDVADPASRRLRQAPSSTMVELFDALGILLSTPCHGKYLGPLPR